MEQKFNWAVVRDNCIEVYEDCPNFMPARESLLKDVEVITNSNGTILLSGQEIVYHLVSGNTPVSKLNFVPAQHEIKCRREGFFKKKYINYVEGGWVEDVDTKRYDAKFSGYSMRFYVSR